MITGTVLGKGFAAQDNCDPLPYKLVTPDGSLANRDILARALAKWTATTVDFLASWPAVKPDLIERARFGSDVLSIVRTNLELGVESNLLAVDADDDVLGAMVYSIVPPRGTDVGLTGSINVVAIDPRFMPNSPFKPQLRGIGTAMVAAAAQRMIRAGVQTVYLHALDSSAEAFWRGKGFADCGGGGLLCIRGQAAIKELVDVCMLRPDDGGEDCLLCGVRRRGGVR